MPLPAPFSPPAQIEEYTIVRPLGRGAMGQVYLAHDTLLDRPVALKFIAGPDAEKLDPGGEALGLRERFFVEARAIARLSHPNVVAIFRVGEWRGRPYLVSELVRGESLDRLARPQPQERVIELGLGLCRGLAAAHRRGVLHRDIKPANAMLTRDGEVKLLDFGLAKLLEPTIAALSASYASLQPLQLPAMAPPPTEAELGATRPGREREELAATRGRPSEPQRPASEPSKPPVAADPAATAETLLAASRDGTSDAGPAVAHASGPDRDAPSLTQHGDVLGSPLYMAPELWRGEPATRAADIYALGTLLYELCAGRAPHDGVSLAELPLRCMELDVPPLNTVRPEIDARLAAVIDRCLRRDPGQRFDSADALREALEELRTRATTAPHIDGNPYRGLQSFEPHHSGLFFGRDAEIRAVLDRLRSEALLVVTGDSGVGKSSLCRAGVLAAIESGALGPRHRVAAIAPGRRPLAALASALAPLLGRDEAPLLEELAATPQEIARELRRRNRGPSPSGPLVLFVDQMEELFTQSPDPAQESFGRALRELCDVAPDVRVLGTVRSDFLSRLAALPGLGPEVGRALFLLGPLAPDGLRESITRPAAACGFRFETPALVEGLVRAAARAPGALPLLSFTLSKLWEARDVSRRLIPAQALERLGGLGGALARHADGVISGMLPAERQVARRVLGLLVTAEGTRARRSRRELGETSDSAAAGAMEALIRGRIVTVHASDEGESQIELAHEILLSSWGTLRGWLAKDAELRAARQRLSSAAAEWQRLGRSRELLWTRVQLAEASALPLRELPEDEAAFLSASRGAVRARRLRWALLIFGAPLAAGLLYLAAQIRASRELRLQIDEQLGLARSEQRVASALNADAERIRQDALLAFDARKKEAGEQLWDRMLAQDSEARQSYRRASKAAEAAFMLGSERSDVRDTLAEILSERALISERNHFFGNRDELLARVWLFDRDGSYKRRWFAPALLSLTTDPPEAAVSLIAIDEQHRSRSEAARALGPGPLRGIEIESGAYLMELRAPGRLTVRYPISLQRGERVSLAIRLPRPAEIPPGFIYVPAGRTLFGSDADDSQRRDFFYHVPIHPVQTDTYLIARHETTYAEWIEYLRALPPEERSRRLPRAGQPGISGTLQLKQRPPSAQPPQATPSEIGFELVLQPTVVAYSAAEGEPLRITAPKRKQSLDWSRLPVTGVSSEDAEAYVGWLQRSGRVTGARLCTEIEWERAARGADERHYPHGDQLLPGDASWDQTYGQDPAAMGPDEVGSHPASRSILGVDDLAGNAFEWVRNSVSDKPYALRGGAYYYGSRTCRIDNRYEAEPTMRNPTVGVRVCATLPARQP